MAVVTLVRGFLGGGGMMCAGRVAVRIAPSAAVPRARMSSAVGAFAQVTRDEFHPHHISASAADMDGNGSPGGRYFLVPGSAGRAAKMAESLTDVTVNDGERGHAVHLGTLPSAGSGGGGIDVGIVSTGMGCPSVDIILTELVKLGGRRFIRVGSCGSLQPDVIKVGSVAIATCAVKDEGTSPRYAPSEFPAIASRSLVNALVEGAKALDLGHLTFAGPMHSKDSLYAREFLAGPTGEESQRYMAHLRALGAIASEMESSLMFTLGSVYSKSPAPVGQLDDGEVMMGAVCGVIGDDNPFADADEQALAVERAIDVAFAGIREMHASECS